jgi:hypothetical protein
VKRFLWLGVLLLSACDDSNVVTQRNADAGVDAAVDAAPSFTETPGVCELGKCPTPKSGLACCTPDAHCGSDPSGLGLTCQPNDEEGSSRKCVLAECPTPLIGDKCCTPTASCGWDPFASGLLCLANAQVNLPDGGAPAPVCDPAACPTSDGGAAACCQANGQCGVDTLGTGVCFPPPNCDLTKCPTTFEGGPRACCQTNGECGIDIFNIGLCFAPPTALCDLAKCPVTDGGAKACCLSNGQCGVDTLGLGLCSLPPATTCDLAACPRSASGVLACCLPNGDCGFDSLGIGICFAPAATGADGGPAPISEPPNDPSITGECPSFIGVSGPIWGCCSGYGVCGQFASNQCFLPVGTQIPTGPPPAADSGVTEAFLRCTPPAKIR